ncbi:MAG: hypothetical protein M1817_001570 [Caeruleum heppii]|nr:MAG: hypothetical protein M1817_001570 [Caeruleum heppii]
MGAMVDEFQPQSGGPGALMPGKVLDWERKQRLREYRVAARRERRTRKADEKKQRKLNATILRRMTKNPEKYTKNAQRNRSRDVEQERRRIWIEAIRQAERLAAIHDPSGVSFNVGPVATMEDGNVISVAVLEKRKERARELEVASAAGEPLRPQPSSRQQLGGPTNGAVTIHDQHMNVDRGPQDQCPPEAGMNLARLAMMHQGSGHGDDTPVPVKNHSGLSKNQQRKVEALAPKAPPPKPVIPDGVALPDGEENWVSLWDLPDHELERRVLRGKKRKAADRKSLRLKQQSGKVERRAARDERRRVYRDIKNEWKVLRAAEKDHKRLIQRIEQEETKKLAVELNNAERAAALARCAELGFALENVEGVAEVQPKVLGMKGVEMDFEAFEARTKTSKVGTKNGKSDPKSRMVKSNRVDLSLVSDERRARMLQPEAEQADAYPGDFVSLDVGGGPDHQELNYNHKLRRKVHRAIEAAQIEKETLVRQKTIEYCEANNLEVPVELKTRAKAVSEKGRRILEDGRLETDKQERVRSRLELTEFNKAAKVLRRQAKERATEAGLRKFAELTGRLPVRET